MVNVWTMESLLIDKMWSTIHVIVCDVTVFSWDYHNYIMPTNACNDNCYEDNYVFGYFPEIPVPHEV